jgi:hypothetical protein
MPVTFASSIEGGENVIECPASSRRILDDGDHVERDQSMESTPEIRLIAPRRMTFTDHSGDLNCCRLIDYHGMTAGQALSKHIQQAGLEFSILPFMVSNKVWKS